MVAQHHLGGSWRKIEIITELGTLSAGTESDCDRGCSCAWRRSKTFLEVRWIDYTAAVAVRRVWQALVLEAVKIDVDA
jgi:hypothetical protein